jgi:methyl-accepting chemotaxis protein
MLFELSNRSLRHKISLLVLGITLVVSLSIGGIGDMILQSVSSGQSKHSSSVANLDRMVNQGGAVLSPVTGIDGTVVGMLVMRKDAGAAVMPASFDGQAVVINAADSVVAPEANYSLGAAHVLLLLAGIVVFAVVALVGTRIARGILEPLGQLEKEVDLLAKGDTSVHISALGRTDEIGRIARSLSRIQESLVELARLKTQHFMGEHVDLVNNLKSFWGGLKQAVRNARELLSSDGEMVGHHMRTSWKNWVHNSLGIPDRA